MLKLYEKTWEFSDILNSSFDYLSIYSRYRSLGVRYPNRASLFHTCWRRKYKLLVNEKISHFQRLLDLSMVESRRNQALCYWQAW